MCKQTGSIGTPSAKLLFTREGGICIDRTTLAADDSQSSKHTGSLPAVQVSNVSAPVMEVVLDFIYTNLMPALPEAFLAEEGAEELFYAADRYLIFPMKVCAFKFPTCSQVRDLAEAHVAGVLVNGLQPAEWEPLGVQRRVGEQGSYSRRSTGHA